MGGHKTAKDLERFASEEEELEDLIVVCRVVAGQGLVKLVYHSAAIEKTQKMLG